MPWNGSGSVQRTDGTRTGPTVWQDARDAAVKILAADHDAHDQDLANAIAACLNLAGENSPAANTDWAGYKITTLGAAAARSDAMNLGQLQDSKAIWGGVAGGTANAQTLSLDPGITSYGTGGLAIRYIVGTTNTAAVTIDVNGIGAVDLLDYQGAALGPGQQQAGDLQTIVFDGAALRVVRPPWQAFRTTAAFPAATSLTLNPAALTNARRITLGIDGLSTDGTSNIIMQLGGSGGIESTGYGGDVIRLTTGANVITSNSTSFVLDPAAAAANALLGVLTLTLIDGATNRWMLSGRLRRGGSAILDIIASKSLSTPLTQILFTMANGTDVFDAGDLRTVVEYNG